jgi:hypothetical protein
MNILTFDIEEWYLEKAYFGAKQSKYAEYDKLLDVLLSKLDEVGLKATFFCVGKMATDFSYVVRKISDAGHEIGCHSNIHQWLNKMSYQEALDDTKLAVDSLEQCIGNKIFSYRAPAFSIGSSNKWIFEILASNGITRDASVFPVSRDFGGFTEFSTNGPATINYKGICIKEFPVCTTSILGKEMAYSGGGYFRFFPLRFVKKTMDKSKCSMTYFHLGDLLPVITGLMSKTEYENYFGETGSVKTRLFRYLKTNIGVKSNKRKLFKLLETTSFENLSTADEMMDWSLYPVVNIESCTNTSSNVYRTSSFQA